MFQSPHPHYSSSRIPVFSYLNPKFKSTAADPRLKGAPLALPAVAPSPAPATAAPSPVARKSAAAAVVAEPRKFFGFLQKTRATDATAATAAAAAKREKKPKKSKADKSDKAGKKSAQAAVAAAAPVANENTALALPRSYPAPFIPSKRIVEHHAYQNIIDEAAAIRMVERLPVLRRFGDTNILRQRNPIRPAADQPSPAARPRLSVRQAFASPHDLLSLDASDASSSSVSSAYGGGGGGRSGSAVRPANGAAASANDYQRRHAAHGHHPFRPHGQSASSASNLSAGSHTTLSDSNSLDSMEHEIVHQRPTTTTTAGRVDQSYLGPFNFRQLLRPTQGPTESLRKRRGIQLSLTPPPMQKGKA